MGLTDDNLDKSWLNYLNLSDEYERKARFVPGILSVLPLAPLVATYSDLDNWSLRGLLTGTGLWAIVSIGISHMASAFGNRFQKHIWPDWPYDSPTNQWLLPTNTSISEQQRQRWYKAIKRLTGLDIEAVRQSHRHSETRAIVNDSVKALRGLLWQAPEAERLRLHNIDYGFARNLTGLRPIWLGLAIASAVGCWIGYFWYGRPLFWSIISTLIVIIALPVGMSVLPNYVRQKATFYAESFFSALLAFEEAKRRPSKNASSLP